MSTAEMTAEREAACERIIADRFHAGEYDFVGRDLLAEVRRLRAALDAARAEVARVEAERARLQEEVGRLSVYGPHIDGAKLQRDLVMARLEADAAGSMMLSVQQDCIAAVTRAERAEAALAALTVAAREDVSARDAYIASMDGADEDVCGARLDVSFAGMRELLAATPADLAVRYGETLMRVAEAVRDACSRRVTLGCRVCDACGEVGIEHDESGEDAEECESCEGSGHAQHSDIHALDLDAIIASVRAR